MQQFKIAFFDIDGTLIDMERKAITQNTVTMLHSLQERGTKICIATGRSPSNLPSIPEVSFDVYMTFNGSYCYSKEGVIYSNPLLHEDVRTIIRNAAALGRPVAAASAARIGTNGTDADLADYFAFSKTTLEVLSDFDAFAREDLYQIMLGCREENYPELVRGTLNAKVAAWWDRAVDVIPKNSGKGEGVRQILQRLQIDPSEAIAFGDGDNDIELLEAVGCGVAMQNASANLKAVADEVCGHVADDGIYYYCLERGLI